VPRSRLNPENPAALLRILRLRVLQGVLGLGCLLGGADLAWGLQPTTPLANYNRQSWVMENGLPQNTVQALAQTRDGFIWLGTEVGLVRFDGVAFQLFDRNTTPALPGNDIRCLLAAKDGALWIGTSEGLARWKDGVITPFTKKEGLVGTEIREIGEVGDVLWVRTSEGTLLFENGRFLITDLRTENPLVNSFNKTSIELAGTSSSPVRLSVGKELPGTRIQALLSDREGNLWIGTNAGLARWSAGRVERLPVTDPLATASVLSLLEDREGNIWAGTETGGLNILRDQRFRILSARDGLSSDATTTVVEDAAVTLWVGTSGAGLNAIRPNAPTKIYTVKNGLLSDVILSLASGPHDDLWVGTPDGLNHIHNGQVDALTSADGLPDDFIRSLLADPDGSVWIGTRRGLTHWNPALRSMTTFTHADGLGSDLVGAMARDAHGDLWVATLAGLSRLRNSGSYTITNFTTKDGLSSNVITALLALQDGTLLIGTQDHGWNSWDGQGFKPAPGDGVADPSIHANADLAIHAILEDGAKHLWFATGTGIARCDRDTSGGCSHWIEFGSADGLRSRETAINSHPSAWRTHDGHLWFATPKGLIEVDPAHFAVNSTPPGVSLERLSIDDTNQPLDNQGSPIKIPAGHVHFEFDYAGLSFVAPQKVRYRYMLEGFDKQWTDAGARRTAYYTNIPAGTYTFRVQAANNDGVWNTEGAALEFKLQPHFYQTIWFYALLALLVAAIVVGLALLVQRRRLRRAEREFDAVLGERNRIAREIHDTLAQGYVGISVQLEVLTELLRQNKIDKAQKQLDTTRDHLREGLADARQSIWALRSQDSGETTLPVRLRRMVENAGNHGLDARFSVFGAYRPLSPGTEQEIQRVAQEAIHNVKKHAGAKTLSVQMAYRPEEIALEVRDDGRGFDPGDRAAAGHFGLTGMRERAAALGGQLEITSGAGMGTTVRLVVSQVPKSRSTPPTIREKTGD
jgi:signal transduction histidine kinase/ligand-binding sensor domain-containing protein